MRKSVSIWPVLGLLLCASVAFLFFSSQLTNSLTESEQKYDQGRVRLTQLESEHGKLKETLATVGTDAFIEHQVRSLFNYMKLDEMRFLIINPEALYGPEGMATE